MSHDKPHKGNKMRATQPRRRVIIATPVKDLYSGISPYYTESLVRTIKLAEANNIDVFPLFHDDALIQRARNYLLSLAHENAVDDLVWIDSDIGFEPEHFFRLLSHPVDVVGGCYPKRSENEDYPVRIEGNKIEVDKKTGLLLIDGIGTGFLRFSKTAIKALWESSKPYKDNGKNGRWAFEISEENGELVGEDIGICHKLKRLGFNIYLDASINCLHIGPKAFRGNFAAFLSKMMPTEIQTQCEK